MAPETAWGESYGKAVDWWSFGTVLYILATGKYPFPNSNSELHTQLIFHGYKTPMGTSPLFNNFLEQVIWNLIGIFC